jgi:hypothetical protein
MPVKPPPGAPAPTANVVSYRQFFLCKTTRLIVAKNVETPEKRHKKFDRGNSFNIIGAHILCVFFR